MKGFSQWWTRSKSLPWIKSRARKENYIYVGLDIDSAKKERERNRWTGRYGCCSADERDLYEFLSDHFIPPFLYFLYGSREGTNGIKKCNTALLCFPRRPLLSIRLALKKKIRIWFTFSRILSDTVNSIVAFYSAYSLFSKFMFFFQ